MTPKARLVRAALRLFNAEGFHAVGIDRILARAGVAKMTLYKHFPSKDELATAAVREKSTSVLAWLAEAGTVDEVFARLGQWFGERDFHGCLFSRAAQDFPEPSHPARKAAATHTRKALALLESLARKKGAGEDLLLLIEGATAVAAKTGAGKLAAERARTAARSLLTP